MFKPCAVIPVYNHQTPLAGIVDHLRRQGLPCLLIDDGSEPACAKAIQSMVQPGSQVQSIVHQSNRGKGAAVKTGLLSAHAQGYSHALQIDADGQHNLADVGRFIDLARNQPEVLIAGYPVFDASIPTLRYYSRYLTTVWVWINTLSLSIKDAMCGFRVYPLSQVCTLLHKRALGDRMDFDIEILVRLYWDNMQVHFVPTKVRYPQDGLSHFRLVEDNLRISAAHGKLFIELLLRLLHLTGKATPHGKRTRGTPQASVDTHTDTR